MSRFINSLLGFDSKSATPEEQEAYRVANEALQIRAITIVNRTNRAGHGMRATTDAFGRAV
jgi:hypothetical protein